MGRRVWYDEGVMKVTECDKCPEAQKFDPETAEPGTLILDRDGDLLVRTNVKWGTNGCAVWLTHRYGAEYNGHLNPGNTGPFTRANRKYLIEND